MSRCHNHRPAARRRAPGEACVAAHRAFAAAPACQPALESPRIALQAITLAQRGRPRAADVYARHRVPLVSSSSRPERLSRCDVALVGLPHAAAANRSRSCAAPACAWFDLSADFRLHDSMSTGVDTASTARRSCWATPLRPDRTCTAEDRRQRPGRQPRSGYSTAAILALAPVASTGLIADRSWTARAACSGAGRSQRSHDSRQLDETLRLEECHGRAPSRRRDRRGAGRAGFAKPATFTPHLLPLDQGLLASCYVARRPATSESRSRATSTRRPTGPSRSSSLQRSHPGARGARHQSLPAHRRRAADGRVLVFAAIDNLWKGAAGQAVQNLNAMLGIDERTGLR